MAQNLQNFHVSICAKRKFLSISTRKKVIIDKPFFPQEKKKENKLSTIDQLLAKELILFMFKQKNGKNPSAFKDVFTKNESKYNTRNKSLFIPKKCFSTVCQQAISHRGPAYWNCIPFDLKNKKQSVRSFTLEVYKYLLSNGNNT